MLIFLLYQGPTLLFLKGVFNHLWSCLQSYIVIIILCKEYMHTVSLEVGIVSIIVLFIRGPLCCEVVDCSTMSYISYIIMAQVKLKVENILYDMFSLYFFCERENRSWSLVSVCGC